MANKTLPIALTVVGGAFAFFLFYPLSQGRMPFRFGLDLAGGVQVSYAPDLSNAAEEYRGRSDRDVLELAKAVLENRLATRLKTEPDVVIRSDNTILVTIPEVRNHRQVAEVVGKTFRLTERLVLEVMDKSTGEADVFPHQGRYYKLDKALFSGDMLDLEAIGVTEGDPRSLDADARAPHVTFKFRPPHDREYADFTEKNVGKQVAILIDNEIQLAPVIKSRIMGDGVITGRYTGEQAREVAAMLRSGAMPVTLRVESVLSIGPTLGESVRKAGTTALLWSLLILFMIVLVAYMHRPWMLLGGTVAYIVLVFSLLGMVAAFGLTIDVPAMAGIILSIGLGMDAFIIVFESLEIKLRKFKPEVIARQCSAILKEIYSFRSDGRVLFHSNTTTLIAVLPLFFIERVRYMMLSVLAGMVASLYTVIVTRGVLQATRHASPTSHLSPIGWMRGRRSRLFSISKPYSVLTVLAVVAAAYVSLTSALGKGSLRTGSEFHEGTQLLVDFSSGHSGERFVSALRQAMPDVTVTPQAVGDQKGGPGQRLLITLDAVLGSGSAATASEGRTAAASNQGGASPATPAARPEENKSLTIPAVANLAENNGGKVMRVDSVGSRISHRRLVTTLGVVAFVLILLPLYILVLQRPIDSLLTHREAQSPLASPTWMGIGIVLALLHDFALMLLTCWWFDIPLSMSVIAAMMTVLGYSVNDSVVLASQIENRAEIEQTHSPLTKATARELVSRSIDAVLSRSILTAATTIVVPIVVAFLKIQDLYDFSIVIGVGIVAGVLSSIYVVGELAVKSLYPGEAAQALAETAEDGTETPPQSEEDFLAEWRKV